MLHFSTKFHLFDLSKTVTGCYGKGGPIQKQEIKMFKSSLLKVKARKTPARPQQTASIHYCSPFQLTQFYGYNTKTDKIIAFWSEKVFFCLFFC